MLLMAVTVPTWGLMFFLIGTIVYPFYYATPENRFEELFYDYIPQWIVPQDLEAIKGYYEGLPKGTPIPWEAWVEPMAWWLGLVVTMGFMLICLSGILHRQWSTHERLAYPMMQLPQGMLAGEEGGVSKVAPLFRNPIMWVGFSLPFLYLTMKGLNFHFPFLPDPNLGASFPMFRGTVHLPMRVVFAYVGFFYLASLDLTFSVWFFYVFCKIQEGIFNVFGISSTERLSAYESYPPAADLTHQQTGGGDRFHPLRPVERPRPPQGRDAHRLEPAQGNRRQRGGAALPHRRRRLSRQLRRHRLLAVALRGAGGVRPGPAHRQRHLLRPGGPRRRHRGGSDGAQPDRAGLLHHFPVSAPRCWEPRASWRSPTPSSGRGNRAPRRWSPPPTASSSPSR